MRGQPNSQSSMLCLVSPEGRVRPDHPLREVKVLADSSLATLSPLFDEMYAAGGRPSVPPERLLKSMLLMAFYSVRSERLFCEQLDYNLLFRWFLDMDMLEDSFDPSTFTKNRQRLMEHEVAAEFFAAVLVQARDEGLVSREHFSVDGTLIEAWASMKSFRPKEQDDADNNGWGDFKGQRRSNDTHESKTDPEARLLRKGRGREAKLCFTGHALMDNRNGLLVDLRVSQADGYAERNVALEMLEQLGERRTTVGADRAYDTKDFVARCRQADVTPHVAQNQNARRRSAIDGRTTRHQGYRISQRIRMRIEQIFGWIKSVAGLRRTRFRGKRKTQHAAYMVGAAYFELKLAMA